ncbi:hypothetical protein P6144_16910 [Sphingomonas sp. HITSZ_GF]|uniref:hypothetical protein n=1 Tax=Sphingomonas sp. HITSZ_GF TaxID=3037247 RepID=UPI00240D1C4F|nr:hypothetical protein [Sphingomonas sp. HITSZ_GF]MDG2535344.1 hypothetical protein [Sphingomonas sp. HITSZ_GF]
MKKFELEYDAGRNRMLVVMRDFWTLETIRDFATAAGAKAQEVRQIRDDYDVLLDTRDFPVQANDVADLLPSIAEGGLRLTSGRAASVVGSLLNKLQAERTQSHPRLRIFMTMDEAEAWLAEPH